MRFELQWSYRPGVRPYSASHYEGLIKVSMQLLACPSWRRVPPAKGGVSCPYVTKQWVWPFRSVALGCPLWQEGGPSLYQVSRFFSINMCYTCGPGSSVGIASDYGLDGPGIESRCGRDFPPVLTCPETHPAYCKMGNGSFPGVKFGRGVLLTIHPLLVPRSWKSRAIPLPTLWATPGL